MGRRVSVQEEIQGAKVAADCFLQVLNGLVLCRQSADQSAEKAKGRQVFFGDAGKVEIQREVDNAGRFCRIDPDRNAAVTGFC